MLPTPITSDCKGYGPADMTRDTTQLRAVHKLMPTPTTQESHSGPSQANRNTPPLNAMVLFMTPVASEGTKPSNVMGVERRQETGQVFLTNQIVSLCGLDPSEGTTGRPETNTDDSQPSKLFPTPEAKLGTSGPDYARMNREGSGGDDLTTAVHRLMPTPRASDPANTSNHASTGFRPPLGQVVRELQTGATTDRLFVDGKPCEEPPLPLPN